MAMNGVLEQDPVPVKEVHCCSRVIGHHPVTIMITMIGIEIDIITTEGEDLVTEIQTTMKQAGAHGMTRIHAGNTVQKVIIDFIIGTQIYTIYIIANILEQI
jgi:hypothetical protein